MQKTLLFLLCSVSFQLFAFTEKPWIIEPYSSEAFLSYAYQYYPSIADQVGDKYASHNNFVQGDLSLAFLDNWDLEAELQLDATTKKDFGFESVGIQGRKGFLNDLAGDYLSLVLGGNVRIVPHGRLIDPSTPYHEVFNIEANVSIGREWNDYFEWYYKTWALIALGQANKGYPWIRADYHFQGKVKEVWEWDIFGIGYFGTGKENSIDLSTFKGYYNIAHRSIDLGLSLSYLFQYWGKMSLSGAYRVYAHAYPRAATTVTLSYTLPFCFF